MDALVKWKDGTKNVVSLNELIPIDKNKPLRKNSKVKMLFKQKWYFGKVLMIDDSQSDSLSSDEGQVLEDFVPLSQLSKKCDGKILERNVEIKNNRSALDSMIIESEADDSDLDPDFKESCEIKKCRSMGKKTCSCGLLVCETHWSASKCDHETFESSDKSVIVKIPTNKKQKILKSTLTSEKPKTNNNPETLPATCSSKDCDDEIFAACTKCLELLCFQHFDEDDECKNHNINVVDETPPHPNELQQDYSNERVPESFTLEGSMREATIKRKRNENQQKLRKLLRNTGLPYTQEKSLNIVAPRSIKEKCKGDPCQKSNRSCKKFSDEDREEIFAAYYKLGNLQLQREFIARHLKKENKKRKTTTLEKSRREHTLTYSLTLSGKTEQVCKTFFLNTLGISERTARTSLEKVKSTGVIEPEKRGGRLPAAADRDAVITDLMTCHIARFPRMESHYCRAQSQREYLHSDLSLEKMFCMYQKEDPENHIGSLETYRKIFKSQKLSFHHPKKDQCTLCISYRSGDEDAKQRLQDKYQKHLAQKLKVREMKENCKKQAIVDKTKACLVFDLQQGAYCDTASYMLMSEESVNDLNKRLDKPVSEHNFRPNIMVKGSPAYSEDSWDWIKIGDQAVMRTFKYCTRCIITSMNPDTAVYDPSTEPLRTLRKYRLVKEPDVKKLEGFSPVMGMYAGLHRSGVINLGDPVYVA